MGPERFPPESALVLFAAVVIPIVAHDDPTLVLVRRAAHLRRNPGQVAFPGGIVDPQDADARATAVREFEEELGVARERLRIVERFDDVVTLARSVTVTPYLGFLDAPVRFSADATETAAVYEVPLRALYERGALRFGVEHVVHDGRTVAVPSWLFDYGAAHVWGATARILRALVARYPSAESVLERA